MSTYVTNHVNLSAFLFFALGDAAHLTTEFVAKPEGKTRYRFTFADEPEGSCKQLADEFFSKDGAAVNDARVLLECRHMLWRSTRKQVTA